VQARLIADHALVQAINNADIPLILELVLPGKASPNTRNGRGYTALITACSKGNQNAVKQLLSVPGIDVNQPEADGWSPLLFASSKGTTSITFPVQLQLNYL
jgi:ankyrin repeat protein